MSARTRGRRSTGSRSRPPPSRRRRCRTWAGRATRVPAVATAFANLNTNMCADLYAQGASAWTQPLYTYSHKSALLPTGPCFNPVNGTDGGSPTGLAFYQGTGGGTDYPAKYAGGLFFVDYDRDCLAFLPAGAGGVPDASGMEVVATSINGPVDLQTGPGGDLYYVDHDLGRVVRILYRPNPVARATADPSKAVAPVTVHLDGSTSSDPDPDRHPDLAVGPRQRRGLRRRDRGHVRLARHDAGRLHRGPRGGEHQRLQGHGPPRRRPHQPSAGPGHRHPGRGSHVGRGRRDHVLGTCRRHRGRRVDRRLASTGTS